MKALLEVLFEDLPTPKYSTDGSAGLDFYIPADVIIPAYGSVKIPLGVKIELPKGYCMVMKEKSGIAVEHRLSVGACVIDSDYRGEVHAHFFSHNSHDVKLYKHTKIIQGVIIKAFQPEIELTKVINNTQRGEGGFGSTGKS